MKKLILLFAALLVAGCGEKTSSEGADSASEKAVASNESSKPSPKGQPKSEEGEESRIESKAKPEPKGLPPIPQTVTAEFIMGVWAKPHDERDFIEELKDDRPGIWKFVRNIGPRKGELVHRMEATVTLKWVDRRFLAQEFSYDGGVHYSVMTYDYEAESYRWWSLGADGFITELSGKRYLRNLREWKSVRLPEEDEQTRSRETVRREKSIKVTFEAKKGGELVAYAEDEATWFGELGSLGENGDSPEGETFGKFTLLDEIQTDNADRSIAKKNAENTLREYPDVDAMIGLWAYNAPQCLEALKDANKLGEVKVFSLDEDPVVLDAIKEGHCEGTIVQDPYLFGYDSIRHLKDIVVNEKMPELNEGRNIQVPLRKIVKDNVEEFRKTGEDRLAAGQKAKGAEAPADAPKFAFITNVADPFWNPTEAGCYVAAKEFGVAVDFQMNSANTIAGQKKILESILNEGDCKGIAISVLNPDNQTTMINNAAGQMPVITVDTDVPDSKRLFFLGTDNYQVGRELGKLIKKSMPDGGKIMIYVGKIDQLNAIQRRDGLLDELSGQTRTGD